MREIRRQKITKPGDALNIRGRSTFRTKSLELSGGCLPVHTSLGILKIVERHHVARRDEITADPSYIRGLENETFRQLTLIREVPRVVDRSNQFRIQRRFD